MQSWHFKMEFQNPDPPLWTRAASKITAFEESGLLKDAYTAYQNLETQETGAVNKSGRFFFFYSLINQAMPETKHYIRLPKVSPNTFELCLTLCCVPKNHVHQSAICFLSFLCTGTLYNQWSLWIVAGWTNENVLEKHFNCRLLFTKQSVYSACKSFGLERLVTGIITVRFVAIQFMLKKLKSKAKFADPVRDLRLPFAS